MRRQSIWVEYQALVDIINVYKVDPVVALGMPATGKPIVKIIRIRMMVEEHTYRRFRLNFLRIHRQAVMGNERRYFYDYYMLCCGPIALADRVENPDQAVAAFGADGGCSMAPGDAWRRACAGAERVTATISKIIWLAFGIAWVVLRQRPGRHSRKTPVRYSGARHRANSFCSPRRSPGSASCRRVYLAVHFPRFADYPFIPVLSYLGIAVDVACLWLF